MSRTNLLETRDRYLIFQPVTTRWKDNDQFGHVNNIVYNAWMDTAVTAYFMKYWELSQAQQLAPVAAETKFTFRQSISHPAEVETGFRVEHIGNSSVRCGVGVFEAGSHQASAWGHMVHVWIDPRSGQSASIPGVVRQGLELAVLDLSSG